MEKYHCKTCGEDYESTGHEIERGDGAMIWHLDKPHRCKFPNSTFFERSETEYQYREGVLFCRDVTYRKYSGHDVCDDSQDLVRASEWDKHESKMANSLRPPLGKCDVF